MKENLPEQLHLRITGGLGITLEGSINVEELPEDVARQIATELTPTQLARVAQRKATPYMPGQQEYEVTLLARDEKEPKRYAFTDQQAEPELLDLMDELTSIIIEKKIRSRRAQKPTQTKAETETIATTSDESVSLIGEKIAGDVGEETAVIPEDDIADSPLASASSR